MRATAALYRRSTLVVTAAIAVMALTGCSGAGSSAPQPSPTQTVATADTVATLARELATADHSRHTTTYLRELRSLAAACHTASVPRLQATVSTGYRALTRHRLAGASYLAVLGSLTAGSGRHGPAGSCGRVLADFVAEVGGPAASKHHYAGYAATLTAWAGAHRADHARAGEFLPRLANGKDTYETFGEGRVATLVRSFDPPLSATVATSVIRRTDLPQEPLHLVYTLHTGNCSEQIFLSHTLGALLSSPSLGVMIELTSGRGVSSRLHSASVDRARFTVGGRIGGQPCV